MVRYKNFLPKITKKSSWGFPEYASIDELEHDLNHWLDENPDFHIINVETVVLPMTEMHKDLDPEKIDTAKLSTYGYYVQFIRAWYKIDIDSLMK